jgi:glycosyltransferase involved in cell wall biosynthesis
MRIAFVYDALVPWVNGGAERRYAELARVLATDHDVSHISWQWWDGPSTMERDGIRYVGVGRPPALYGADGKRTVREAAAFAARIVPALLRGGWDVVDCSATPYLPLYGAWTATRVTRTPLVATWHESWGSHWAEYLPGRPAVARVAQALERGARPLADAVVAVSPFTMRRMGVEPSDRQRIVPNGVSASGWSAGSGAARGAAMRDVDVVSVGRLIDEKRIDLLIGAVAILRGRGRDATTVIAGDGPERTALEQMAAERGVADLVTFAGRVDDAARAELLSRGRVAVLPSQREGFGIGVLEAQVAGTVPIVTSGPHTAAPDLIRDGVDGLVVPPTAQAIATGIDRLLADDRGRESMRAAAMAAADGSDWRRIADEMARLYTELARTRRVPVGAG